MQIKVHWTNDYRQSRFVETGEMPASTEKLEVDPRELSPEARQILVNAGLAGKKEIDLTTLEKYKAGGDALFQVSGNMDIEQIRLCTKT